MRLTSRGGTMRYLLEGPERAASVLRMPGYSDVDVVQSGDWRIPRVRFEGAAPTTAGNAAVVMRKEPAARSVPESDRKVYAARAELVLARQDHRPLATPGARPDPLQRVAAAMAGLGNSEGAEVVVDLVPVPDGQVSRRRRQLLARAKQRGRTAFGESVPGAGGALGGLWSAIVDVVGTPSGRPTRPAPVPRQADLTDGVGKFRPGEPVFAVQLLLQVTATHPGRARARLNQLLAAMEAWTGENRWVPAGPHRTAWRPYSNVWWRRPGFDRRLASGAFAPAKRQWLTVAELAGLLKPPTQACAATNVARCGGVVPAAPDTLPVYSGQQGVVPLGMVLRSDGRTALAGVPEGGILFGAFFGKSGFGKTELSLVQAIARAYAGRGVWFLDPHGAAVTRAKPYLTHPAILPRLWEINLGKPAMTDTIASWNLLSMEGRRPEDIQDVIGSVVGAIASAQGWGDGAPRARTILTQSVWALAELSLRMVRDGRPDLQPTIFQLRTLLTNEAWRQEVVAELPPDMQAFWRNIFPGFTADAVPVVTNILDRMYASLSLRAFLGSPRSTYNVRQAMDDGRIVLISPSGTGEADELITSLLIFDLFQAGLSRQDTDPDKLRQFWAWVDELKAVDGASRGFIAKILEQLRKYEIRFMVATQMAMRLSDTTRQALMQNQSLLSATAADTDEARFVTARFPHVSHQTVESLNRFEYVMSVMVGHQRSTPFKVRGVPVHDLYADYYNPAGLDALEAAVDQNMARRTVGEIVTDLQRLDDRILAHLAGVDGKGGEGGAAGIPAGPTARPPADGGDLVLDLPSTAPTIHLTKKEVA
ncbi:type IV secretory system conjugative DNA transfer family protein [Actinacidiphila rubida]|uniref:hypothetical protein n=1 Tax=Actinacidiphila rubida TaxID=310780 RepID=UPI00114CCE6E|nr:hypothetical protein [Actinacidiphila rubida]